MRIWFPLTLVTLLIHFNLYAGKDFPAEEGYLVHVTETMMKNSVAIPGATINGEITDNSKAPEMRTTLHHTYQGMVPDEAMAASLTLWGIPLNIASNANQHRRYAWIDRFKNYVGHIFGGEINDIYTLGHTYGAGSFVIIPEEEQADFTKTNPKYDGTIVTYTEEEKIRDVVNRVLIEVSGLVVNYTKKQGESLDQYEQAYWLDIEGKRIPEQVVRDFLESQNFVRSNHNYSPFQHYESIIGVLSNPFHLRARGSEILYRSLKTSAHMNMFLAMYPFMKERLRRASAHLDDAHRKRLVHWLEENQTFVDLIRMELDLRKKGRSLFFDNPKLTEHISRRATLKIEEASEDLRELTAQEMKILEGTETTGDGFYVPAYLGNIFSFDPQFYGDFIAVTPWSPVKKSIFQIDRLIKLYLRTKQMDKPWTEAMIAAVAPLRRIQIPADEFKEIQEYFNAHVWDKFWKDTSKSGEHILPLYNHPDFGIILRQLMLVPPKPLIAQEHILHLILAGQADETRKLMAPKVPNREPLDLLGMLKVTVIGQYFWGEETFLARQLLFLKNMLKHVPIDNLNDARAIYSAYSYAEDAASILPLAFIHFCGDLLDTFLAKNPPTRELTEGEKGSLIGTLNLMLPSLYKATEKQFHLSVPPTAGNEDKREIRQLFIRQLIGDKTDEEEAVDEKEGGEEEATLAPTLHALVAKTATFPPQYAHPLSPEETYQLLKLKHASFLSLVRGGCFGGLQGVIKECGYEDAYQQYFGPEQDAAWYIEWELLTNGNTLNSLFQLLRDVQGSGAESVRRRYEQADNFWF